VIEQVNRLGNNMLQYMFARAVQRYAKRQVVLCGYDMPLWGLVSPFSPPSTLNAPCVSSHLTEARYVAEVIDRLAVRAVRMTDLCLRLESLLPAQDYVDAFPLIDGCGRTFPADRLVIHIRAGDVVQENFHAGYGPLPMSYYKTLIRETGLTPVFVGEVHTEPYASKLRAAFRDAEFISASVMDDFQTLRRAKNLALSVSTFSWLAAYFSAADAIHLPVAGFLNPLGQPDMDALPLDDARFRFRTVPDAVWAARFNDYDAANAHFPLMSSEEILARKRQARSAMSYARMKDRVRIAVRGSYHRVSGLLSPMEKRLNVSGIG
jgi:hypothetical protein